MDRDAQRALEFGGNPRGQSNYTLRRIMPRGRWNSGVIHVDRDAQRALEFGGNPRADLPPKISLIGSYPISWL